MSFNIFFSSHVLGNMRCCILNNQRQQVNHLCYKLVNPHTCNSFCIQILYRLILIQFSSIDELLSRGWRLNLIFVLFCWWFESIFFLFNKKIFFFEKIGKKYQRKCSVVCQLQFGNISFSEVFHRSLKIGLNAKPRLYGEKCGNAKLLVSFGRDLVCEKNGYIKIWNIDWKF